MVKLTRRAFIHAGAATSVTPFLTRTSIAQSWPSKNIRFVVSSSPGGFTDLMARAYGDYISKQLGQPVIVVNKAGAGGALAAVDVKRADPDGCTLLFTISATMITNKVLYKTLPYDPDKDFEPVAYMPTGGVPLVVAKDTGASTLMEFVEFARKNPINIGTYSAGSWAHIAIVELNKQFNLDAQPVHFKGESPMFTGIATGSIQGALGTMTSAQSVIDAGLGRAVAVSMSKRLKKIPDVPTFFEQGATSTAFKLTPFICAVAARGVADRIVNRYSELFSEAGRSERVQQVMETFGLDDPAVGREGFQKLLTEEGPIWLDLVNKLGMTAE